ncbi:MAG TPA: polyprenyl synthetase family protein [Devosia sp.]|nr:polyprenyl synthetase family protein [Devosia sp.]
MPDLSTEIAEHAALIERFLDSHLSNADNAPLMGTPGRLLAAMRHGALGGGKRLRPYLVRTVAGMYGMPPEATVRAGAAIEMVHSYSLVHDDLPDMDNDRLRRGKPSVWAAYDPAMAILAGDALLTEAFRVLAGPETHADPAIRIRLVQSLAVRAGAMGMVGGQVLDIEGEGQPRSLDEITAMQQMKTGDMIVTSVEIGAILGGETHIGPLTLCADHAGLAFQIADDILDATASSEALGKTAGKDAAQGKATVVASIGLDGARKMLDDCVSDALTLLDDFGPRAERLRDVIRFFATREN